MRFFLTAADSCLQLAISLIEQMRQSFRLEDCKLDLLEDARRTYETSIHLCMRLYENKEPKSIWIVRSAFRTIKGSLAV